MTPRTFSLFFAPVSVSALLVFAATPVFAEVTADAVLEALVRKGVLTAAEAAAVRAEAETNAAPPVSASPPPDSHLSISGYLQARAVSAGGRASSSALMVRRARLKVQHKSERGDVVFALDGGQNAVVVKDAYLDYLAVPARAGRGGLSVRFGQFNRPFGFAIERSDADAEFPERPAGWAVLFPGERDQGIGATWDATTDMRWDIALVNGGGAGSASLPARDPDNYKDALARVRYVLRGGRGRNAELALSGYKGKQMAGGATGDRDRLGIAGNLPAIAGGTVRAEYVRGRDLTTSPLADPAEATAPALAWYVAYTHPLAHRVTVGMRYDAFDPDTRNRIRPDGDGEVRTMGLVALRDLSANMRVTLAYERSVTTRYSASQGKGRDTTGNVLTLQGQYRF
jgi:hypothetical protein